MLKSDAECSASARILTASAQITKQSAPQALEFDNRKCSNPMQSAPQALRILTASAQIRCRVLRKRSNPNRKCSNPMQSAPQALKFDNRKCSNHEAECSASARILTASAQIRCRVLKSEGRVLRKRSNPNRKCSNHEAECSASASNPNRKCSNPKAECSASAQILIRKCLNPMQSAPQALES